MIEALSLLATVAIAIWGAYKWFVTRPRERAQLELLNQELELEAEIPFIEFHYDVETCKQGEQLALIIQVRATNKGKRLAVCSVSHNDVLTIAKVKKEGDTVQFEKHQYAQYFMLEKGNAEPWNIVSLIPEATKTFPFIALIDSPGLYYVQIRLRMTDENEVKVREKYDYDPSKPIYWSGSTYVSASV